jgi:pimeloyl-ACP methyl ester carboxylesterase
MRSNNMQRRVGHVGIESIAAETAKFTAPMLLVHGLWCAAPVWRKFMGYLAHRGWTCHALSLRGRGDARSERTIAHLCFADYQHDVRQVIDACEAPPVVVGHDLGGLLALSCAPSTPRAIIALAPLVPRSVAAVPSPAGYHLWSRLAAVRARALHPPRGKLGAAYFGSGAPGGTLADSACVVRELVRKSFQLPRGSNAPALVLAGERDPFCPPRAAQALAQHFRTSLLIAQDAGHAMPWEPGWEQRVDDIHRWLIQTLGEPLLVPCEEQE